MKASFGEEQRRSRRDVVPFDPYFFEKQARRDVTFSMQDTFELIYRGNHWSGDASVSGAGADLTQTQRLRAALPKLLRAFDVDVLLDLPCGDFGWMQHVDLPVSQYLGADVVPALVARNEALYGGPRRRFTTLDLTRDPLPTAGLLLCRDCLVHLSFEAIGRALCNIRESHLAYLLTTTFPACRVNEDITTGDWRVLNLEKPPFSFPPPLRLINEGCSEADGLFRDKSLGLWRVQDVPVEQRAGRPDRAKPR